MIEIGVIPRASTLPLRLPGTPHDPNAGPHHSPVSRTGARRQLSTPPLRYRFPVPATDGIQPINPPSRGDLRRHLSICIPRQPPTSRSRLTGASPRTGIAFAPRASAALNPHSPRPRSAAPFNQASVQSRAPSAQSTAHVTRDRAEPSIIPMKSPADSEMMSPGGTR
jgi:hypothetical protein